MYSVNVLIVYYHNLPGARASTPDSRDDSLDEPAVPPLDGHDDDPEPLLNVPGQGRVKARASMRPISPGHVLARLSDPLSHAVQELIDNLGSHYNIAEGSQTPGVPCSSSRVGMKRRAESITRSQYEVYSFSTKYDLPEAAVDELLRMLSNVCIHAHVFWFISICLSQSELGWNNYAKVEVVSCLSNCGPSTT